MWAVVNRKRSPAHMWLSHHCSLTRSRSLVTIICLVFEPPATYTDMLIRFQAPSWKGNVLQCFFFFSFPHCLFDALRRCELNGPPIPNTTAVKIHPLCAGCHCLATISTPLLYSYCTQGRITHGKNPPLSLVITIIMMM